MKRYLATSHQPLAPKRAAFTLIELLVVISVIALLLALLIPALRGARNQARKVMCRSNLRQFSSVLYMYVEDNEGRLPSGVGSALWLLRGSSPGQKHHQDPNVPEVSQSVRMARAALCPMAVKPGENPGEWIVGSIHIDNIETTTYYWIKGRSGSQFRAWTITSPGPVFRGSYGLNFFPFGMRGSGFFPERPGRLSIRRGLNVFSVASRSKVPILLDSRSPGAQPWDVSIPLMPSCINRHSGRVNGLFLNWSVREVGLKELWTLKWCPNFDTAGPWTKAGGVRPEDWPEWMRGFKDY